MSELCTNCDNVTDHEVATLDCSGPRPSGVADAVLALCGNSIVDPSDGTQWATAKAGGFAKELFNITGSIDSGDATLAPKPPLAEFREPSTPLTRGLLWITTSHLQTLISGIPS